MSAHPATAPGDISAGTLLGRRISGLLQRNATTILIGLAIAALVLPPIVTVIYSGFVNGNNVWHGTRTLAHYRDVLGSSTSLDTIKNSLIFAAGSALLSVAFAAIVAFFVERTNAPFRRLVYFTVIIALGVPIVVETIGWVLLIGPNASFVNTILVDVFGKGAPQFDIYSMYWMIFVQATIVFPAIFLLVAPAFRLADPALEQAASVSGATKVQILRTITLPLVLPSLLAAVLLSFIVGIESFEVPALIGTPSHISTLSTAMYTLINNSVIPDFGAAAAFATLLLVFTIVGLYLYQRATKRAHRFVTVTGKGYRPEKIDLLKFRWPSAIVTFLVPAVVLAPVFVLLWASFQKFYSPPSWRQVRQMSFANYHSVLKDPTFTSALKNTFELGFGAAVIVMAIGLVAAWSVVRRPSALSKTVDHLGNLPLVVPGVVLSLAMLRVFINFPLPIYGTVWIILIALVVHYIPWGLRYNHAGLISLSTELEEASDVSGASRLRTFAQVVLPLMRPTLFAGGLFVFMATMRQLSLVIFLSGPNLNVVSSWIWYIWNNAQLAQAATAAMVSIVPVLVIAAVFYRVAGIGKEDSGAVRVR